MQKKLASLVVIILLFSIHSLAAQVKTLYDDTHGQTAGNADWVLHGAYSEVADMLKAEGFSIDSLKEISAAGKITPELLSNYKVVILAEPNNPYSKEEQDAIVEFVKNGGGAFLVSDHGGADRDNDGYDAVKVFNCFVPQFGFQFNGDTVYEAPMSGPMNSSHPAMFGVRGIGAWAGSTISILRMRDSSAVSLVDSRFKKAPYIVAAESGKGRVVAIGDSSPFDDGIGSGDKNKLHDSYDSFMFSHPQFAYNSMKWVSGATPDKRIPSRIVKTVVEADASKKDSNIFIDASHGNAASDKMDTFERHVNKLGFSVFYNMTTINAENLAKFSIVILPDPSLGLMDTEIQALSDWLMAGGNLVVAGDWDSSRLKNIRSLNSLLEKCGSVMRFNSDQVWDKTNKTNKAWGVVAHTFKKGNQLFKNVKQLITWGTCSLITRENTLLTEEAGVEILVMGDDDSENKDGDKKNDAVIYPVGGNPAIPIVALEKLAKGKLVALGCCNFTDYQYPDSDINTSQTTPPPVVHETAEFYDNLIQFLAEKR
ncbi:MAG: hypothetical protein HQM10_01640 [Candidatus Riflebacteria bacterium]|nr:hypothetical protein [Candidatus Riflebacteria bacterium]